MLVAFFMFMANSDSDLCTGGKDSELERVRELNRHVDSNRPRACDGRSAHFGVEVRAADN